MATITLGTDALEFPNLSFTYDILDTLRNSPSVVSDSNTATATWHRSLDDGNGGTLSFDNIVSFQGTGLNTVDGTITSMSFSLTQDGTTFQEFDATGFDIDSGDMLAAINAAGEGDREPLKAIFEGVGWTLHATSLTSDNSTYFQGTGGNDTVTMGASLDQLGLDGGNDDIKLGAGEDSIIFFTALGYAAEGQSKVDGGAGEDWLHLDYGLERLTDQYIHLNGGLTVNLNKAVDFGEFSVKFKSVEIVTGTRYTDTIIGTKANENFNGFGGGDLLVGGGGSDTLISSAEVDDFFRYVKASDSKVGKGHDMIFDYEAGLDVIDLAKIDPGTKNHAFKFVGDNALKHVGDLHVVFHNKPGAENDYYLVEANLDKDKAAEFQIEVHSLEHLTKHDFIL